MSALPRCTAHPRDCHPAISMKYRTVLRTPRRLRLHTSRMRRAWPVCDWRMPSPTLSPIAEAVWLTCQLDLVFAPLTCKGINLVPITRNCMQSFVAHWAFHWVSPALSCRVFVTNYNFHKCSSFSLRGSGVLSGHVDTLTTSGLTPPVRRWNSFHSTRGECHPNKFRRERKSTSPSIL